MINDDDDDDDDDIVGVWYCIAFIIITIILMIDVLMKWMCSLQDAYSMSEAEVTAYALSLDMDIGNVSIQWLMYF